MKPDIHPLRGAAIHHRCPQCANLVRFVGAKVECGNGCDLDRCTKDDCGEVYHPGDGHVCEARP